MYQSCRFLISLLLLTTAGAYAQQPLERTVTLSITRTRVDTALARVSRQAPCSFSYIGTPFRKDSIVSFAVSNRPVRFVLDLLFEGRLGYKESGDNIILQPGDGTRERTYYVSGYVRDRQNGQGIANASIYEHTNLASAMTNHEGYFHLRLKDKGRLPSMQLTVSKEFYRDTALYIIPGYDREISVAISPAQTVTLKGVTVTDGVEKTWFGQWLLPGTLRRQTRNISNFFANKPFQSSLVPSLGSHGKMAGQVVNKFSLNLVGGYAAGLDGVEIAAGFNVNKKDVQYAQVAGIFNVVGGNMKGAQATGGINRVLLSVQGAQAAGLSNTVNGDMQGAQATGGLNKVSGNMKGAQAAGLGNIVGRSSRSKVDDPGNVAGDTSNHSNTTPGGPFTNSGSNSSLYAPGITGAQFSGIINLVSSGTMHGIQATGVFNYAHNNALGWQVAGISNFVDSGKLTGAQVSGILNHAKMDVKGLQLAGIINNTGGSVTGLQLTAGGNRSNGEVRGLQFAPFFNYSRKLKGIQLGLINIADSSEGFSAGVINIVRRNGLHQLSIDANEMMPVNFTLKTGRKQCYMLTTFGLGNDETKYAPGLGFGHLFTLPGKFGLTAEGWYQRIYNNKWRIRAQAIRLQPQVQYAFTKWLSIHAGPAFTFSEDKDDVLHGAGMKIGSGYKGWLGWQAGISLF